jgi:hypothetical protein
MYQGKEIRRGEYDSKRIAKPNCVTQAYPFRVKPKTVTLPKLQAIIVDITMKDTRKGNRNLVKTFI